MDIVRAGATKILRRMERYIDLDSAQAERPEWVASAGVMPDERVLGSYRNGPDPGESLLVTTHGIRHQLSGEWRLIAYGDIERVPLRSKADRSVELRLRDGGVVVLPVLGGKGKFRDALEFMRFLNNVSIDNVSIDSER